MADDELHEAIIHMNHDSSHAAVLLYSVISIVDCSL